MKKLSLFFLSLMCITLWSCSDDENPAIEVVVNFSDKLTDPNSSFQPEGGEVDGYYKVVTFTDTRKLVEMPSYYSDWGFGGGFTYTNISDKTTPGYMNLGNITGVGRTGSVYLTANSNAYTPAYVKNLDVSKYQFKGAWVTNSTYAYLAVKDGNDGNNPALVRKFGDGDWFKLTAVGYDVSDKELGRVDFYLADYRDGQSKVVNTWEWFDWSALATADHISFELSSTDSGEFGMNTPSYFCMDGITLVEK